MKYGLLHGSGGSKEPYYIKGFRNEECSNLKDVFAICDRESIEQLNIAYSGRYYEKRIDGWYETSDSEICDEIHGLPYEGRKVC